MLPIRIICLSLLGCSHAAAPVTTPGPGVAFPAHPGSQFDVSLGVTETGFKGGLLRDKGDRPPTLASRGLAVIRDRLELEASGLSPDRAVDFDREVLLVLGAGEPEGAPASPVQQVVRISPANASVDRAGMVTVRFRDPCSGICGGASTVVLHMRECLSRSRPAAFSVPRPAMHLRVIAEEHSCDPALP
jgi:hypothetical protein